MCTSAIVCPEEELDLATEAESSQPQFSREQAHRDLLKHVSDCLDCLFVITKQREPLVVAGCPRFQALLAAAHPLLDYFESPLGSVHISEDMIENYHFHRLSILENKIFEAHINTCSDCERKLHDHQLFIYALQTALREDPTYYQNRTGATFAAAAGAV
jgi:hypothetical protein